jgi:uncharacterized membrane protein YidH (DUF202 family)
MASLFEPPRADPGPSGRSLPRLDHAVLVIGAAIMIVAARLPWMIGQTRASGYVDWTGIDDTGEGGMLLVIGLLVLAFVRWRGTFEEIEPRSRWIPLGLGFAAVCLWVISFRHLVTMSFDTPGGARLQIGVFLAGIGVLFTVVGAVLAARRWADPESPPRRRADRHDAAPLTLEHGSDGYMTRGRVERRDPPPEG